MIERLARDGGRMMRLMLATFLISMASAVNQRKISTWVKPGGGGPMGNDLTEALAWVKVPCKFNKQHRCNR